MVKAIVDPVPGSGTILHTSLDYSPIGEIHATYLLFNDPGTLRNYVKHAWKSAGTWNVEVVDSTIGFDFYTGTSIEVDSTGAVHIAYPFSDPTVGLGQFMKYAKKSGGAWVIELADATTRNRYPSLELDGQGNPRIAYEWRGSGEFGLKYAEKNGGVWAIAVADSGHHIGAYASLALDSQGLPHMSCQAQDPSDLHYVVGASPLTGVGSAEPAGRAQLLSGNAPNPFAAATRIRYDLPARAQVRLDVFDAAGRLVRTLVDAPSGAPGAHEAVWDGRSERGEAVAAGVYFYRLQSDRLTETRSMVLVR